MARNNVVIHQNEDLVVKARFLLSDTPLVMTGAHFRGVMTVEGVEQELFNVIPEVDGDGWIIGFVPASTMQTLPIGVGDYDLVVQFQGHNKVNVSDGTLEIRRGISQWP